MGALGRAVHHHPFVLLCPVSNAGNKRGNLRNELRKCRLYSTERNAMPSEATKSVPAEAAQLSAPVEFDQFEFMDGESRDANGELRAKVKLFAGPGEARSHWYWSRIITEWTG